MAHRLKKLRSNKIILALASLKIAVVGLILLFILTFWGTVAQVENGLYAAQERYFSSFYFLAMGFLPFPGAQLVLWVLGVNLVCAFFTRIIYAGERIGMVIVHSGLGLFLIAAFVTLHSAVESHLTLREGQTSNVSQAYNVWEVAVRKGEGKDNLVYAIDATDQFDEGKPVNFDTLGLNFTIKKYYKNAQAFSALPGEPNRPFAGIKEKYLSSASLNVLRPVALEKEREKNVPGIILEFLNAPAKPLVLLYGSDEQPTQLTLADKTYSISLRAKRYPLPISVKLVDFMMDKHPGTEVARSYKSKVEIEHDGIRRELMISMNEPLRFKDFTFYQSSYQIDTMGREYSTLAVVKNAGRVLPYVATFVVTFGLALHFLLAAFKFQRKRK